jgi:hypothetical protein
LEAEDGENEEHPASAGNRPIEATKRTRRPPPRRPAVNLLTPPRARNPCVPIVQLYSNHTMSISRRVPATANGKWPYPVQYRRKVPAIRRVQQLPAQRSGRAGEFGILSVPFAATSAIKCYRAPDRGRTACLESRLTFRPLRVVRGTCSPPTRRMISAKTTSPAGCRGAVHSSSTNGSRLCFWTMRKTT